MYLPADPKVTRLSDVELPTYSTVLQIQFIYRIPYIIVFRFCSEIVLVFKKVFNMNSRSPSSASNSSIPRRPVPKPRPKPAHLRTLSIERPDADLLDDTDDLLGSDGDDSVHSPIYEALPPRRRHRPQPDFTKFDDEFSTPKVNGAGYQHDKSHKMVIAVDFGTTFTGMHAFLFNPLHPFSRFLPGVAFATPQSAEANLHDIRVLDNWGKGMDNDPKIPSVISYSSSTDGSQQWGKSLSPEAVTMINMKLELDVQDNKTDELELIIQALDGMSNLHFQHVRASKGCPEYTWKTPEEIVTDYLSRVYQCLDKEIEKFSPELRARLPVDIVITVPVV